MEDSIIFKQLTEESGNKEVPENGEIQTENESNKLHLELDILSYIESQKKLKNIKNTVSEINTPSTSNQNPRFNTQILPKIESVDYLCNENENILRKRKTENVEHKVKRRKRATSNNSDVELEKILNSDQSGSEYVPSGSDIDDDEDYVGRKTPTEKRPRNPSSSKIKKARDDGVLSNFNNRNRKIENDSSADKKLEYKVKVPNCIWSKLYQYQKIGVKWMNELNHQKVGGLLGDEMGLGKTVQVIAFLAALHYSKIPFAGYKSGLGPCLIVCPATIMHQWVKHFHEWWPPLRVAILHQSGSFKGRANDLIREMNKESGVLLTTYQGMLKYNKLLCELNWHYVVLDEGHKIRNPSAKVTEAIKHIQTPHRLILTGSPMQNNLTELWSLFDFIVPGKLGTLQVFMDHFATPILQGGYANASPFQEATALSIATALKNLITPYMLRRAKVDVNIDLPNKNEQVLFCELTREQTDLYKQYLMAEHVGTLLNKDHRLSNNMFRAKMLMAVTVLRKICNHPDLYLGDVEEDAPNISKLPREIPIEERFGYYKRAGKMKVVAALLKIWKRQNHRVLLFTQTRSMIEIFEEFMVQHDYKYLKMDGATSIGSRQPLIEQFNNNSEYFLFILTTRVGGLGINLTGANRVIIYDPDWNPATDIQARERAWRIGQKKNVTVYRLLSAGTIEEKMYQRQIWKQLLSNKVLTDAKQKRFFKLSDLHELFSLQEPSKNGNIETLNIFQDSKVEMSKLDTSTTLFSEEKLKAMKDLAQKLAKKITPTTSTSHNDISETKKNLTSTCKNVNPPVEDENFIWDPTTVRFKKMRKIIIPPEVVEKNYIGEKETNIPFNDILAKLDTGAPLLETTEIEASCSDFPDSSSTLDAIKLSEKSSAVSTSEEIHFGNSLERRKKCDIEPNDDKKTEIMNSNCKKEPTSSKSGKKSRHKSDNLVDGEMVKGVVKKEGFNKLSKRENHDLNEQQDAYVLNQLFSKGVHTALKHDSIVRSGFEEKHSLKDRMEAERKAKNALKVLKTTRLRNWRW